MLYTMKDKKDNKVYIVKSMDEVKLKEANDLFVVKLDGAKLHTYYEFDKVAKAAFQTPTDKSMFWLHTPANLFLCWVTELDWLMDAGFNSFALIVENWSKALNRDKKEEKDSLLYNFNYVCDFWGYEILSNRGNGYLETESEYCKPRNFNIYLVG